VVNYADLQSSADNPEVRIKRQRLPRSTLRDPMSELHYYPMSDLQEIIVRGGLPRDPHAVVISADGARRELEAEPGESTDAFRSRVRSLAVLEHAGTVLFFGMAI
jgi:hypothetical protein